MEIDNFYVSVIIPVYNGESFLTEAVESIKRQDYNPLEIIIVDDGSRDRTGKIAKSLKGNIRYHYQSNRGPGAARNKGLEMSNGNIIGFLDVDDLWSADKLKIQLLHLSIDTSVEIVIGRMQRMEQIGFADGKAQFQEFQGPRSALSLGCSLFRRSVFDKVGLFDETLYYCDDTDWSMRARELNVTIVMHPEVTLICRRHNNNITNNVELGNHYTIRMIKKSIDRRRHKNKGEAESLPRLTIFKEESVESIYNDNETRDES
jgi:glycosyltransferase involved in cell wall biosynthesis